MLTRNGRGKAVTAARWPRRAALLPLLGFLATAGATYWWLDRVSQPLMVMNGDAVRDQLLALDCSALGICHTIGANTSFAHLYHGAVWIDALVAAQLLGGTVFAEHAIVLVALAFAAATVCVVVWRWLRPSLALPVWLAFVVVMGADRTPGALTNPSVSLLPNVLVSAALLCHALSGRRRFAIAAGFALGIAINAHVAAISLLPPLLAVAAVARPRPWATMSAAIATMIGTCLITSGAALVANLAMLDQHRWLLPAVVGNAIIALVAWPCGAWFRCQSPAVRAWLVGIGMVVPYGLGTLWLLVSQQHHFSAFYLYPVLPPMVVLAVALAALPFEHARRAWPPLRWFPATVSVAIVASLAHPQADATRAPFADLNSWSIADVHAVADQAMKRGWEFEDLRFRVQASECRELLNGMSVALPPSHGARRDSERQLQVLRASRGAVADLGNTVETVALSGDRVAVLRDVRSWLRPHSLRVCLQSIDVAEPPLCATAAPSDPGLGGVRTLSARATPEIHSLVTRPPYLVRYQIPLAPAAGERRELIVLDGGAACAWRVTQVDGVQVESALPAGAVRLYSPAGASGTVTLEKRFGSSDCPSAYVDDRYPPCLFESTPDDPLRALLTSG